MSAYADVVMEDGRLVVGLEEGFARSLAVFGNRVLTTGAVAEVELVDRIDDTRNQRQESASAGGDNGAR